MKSLKFILKSVLLPFRKVAGRFVILPEPSHAISPEMAQSILYKAAKITSMEIVDGDYLEFGVFQGASFINAYNILKQVYEERFTHERQLHGDELCARIRNRWENIRFIAFDSFEGLPEMCGTDTQTNDFVKGKFCCNEEDFIKNIKGKGVMLEKVATVPGWFEKTCSEETKKKLRLTKASIVHIDCDLYESTKVVLDFITPLLDDGTIIIFDDWYCYRGNPELGEQKAFYEWVEKLPDWTFTQFQKESHTRNSFISNHKINQ